MSKLTVIACFHTIILTGFNKIEEEPLFLEKVWWIDNYSLILQV